MKEILDLPLISGAGEQGGRGCERIIMPMNADEFLSVGQTNIIDIVKFRFLTLTSSVSRREVYINSYF